MKTAVRVVAGVAGVSAGLLVFVTVARSLGLVAALLGVAFWAQLRWLRARRAAPAAVDGHALGRAHL